MMDLILLEACRNILILGFNRHFSLIHTQMSQIISAAILKNKLPWVYEWDVKRLVQYYVSLSYCGKHLKFMNSPVDSILYFFLTINVMKSFTMPRIHTEQILKDFGIYYNCPMTSYFILPNIQSYYFHINCSPQSRAIKRMKTIRRVCPMTF